MGAGRNPRMGSDVTPRPPNEDLLRDPPAAAVSDAAPLR